MHEYTFLEDFILEQLQTMGYQQIKYIHVDSFQRRLFYQAILPSEMIQQLAYAYFGPNQITELEKTLRNGQLEFIVFPDRHSTLTFGGKTVASLKLDRKQRRVVNDLSAVLKTKVRMDYGYIRRALPE